MNLKTRFGSGGPAVALAVATGLAVIGGAVAIVSFGGSEDEPVGVLSEQTEEQVEDMATAQPEGAPASEAPRLDVVRIAPDGAAVIAGQAPVALSLDILLDGEVLAQAIPDGNGDFVALTTVLPSDQPRSLTIIGRGPDGLEVSGAETVLVAPFGDGGVETVAALESPDPSPAETPSSDTTIITTTDPAAPPADDAAGAEIEPDLATPSTDQPDAVTPDVGATPQVAADQAPSTVPEIANAPAETAEVEPSPSDLPAEAPQATEAVTPDIAEGAQTEAPDIVAEAPSNPDTSPNSRPDIATPEAPTVVIAGPEGVRVTQGGAQPQAQTQVLLDAISYNVEGDVILAGRGPAEADLEISLDNEAIQLGEVGLDGAWSLELPDVDPGTYTLSVAELGADGREESRVETPFLREDPDRIAAAPDQVAARGVDVITVQPGFTLWGIADRTFGEGLLYVQIFEENQDQIRDPNWIFPGQIFRLPDLPRTSGDN